MNNTWIDGIIAGASLAGVAGADAFLRTLQDASGLKASTGSHACHAALQAYGGVRRLAFMSPYFPAANAEVRRYFQEAGYEVVRDLCLQCPSWTAIANIPATAIRDTFQRLDGDGVDAIVQVGTNLNAAKLCAAAEQWLGKPVIAINTAIYWHALRMNGLVDRIAGYGRLLEDF